MNKKILIISAVFPPEQVTSAFLNYDLAHELAKEYEGQVVIGKCNTDENNDTAMNFGVRNIPMFAFLKNGEVVETLVGSQPKANFVKLIESYK